MTQGDSYLWSRPKPFSDEVIEHIQKWEEKEKSRVFGLISSGFHGTFGRQEIGGWQIPHIRQELEEFTPVDKIDIFLESFGGEADAAYLIVNHLRSKCKSLRAIVPTYAKSAATLLCLGVDDILMAENAALGPLDAQILDPRHPEEHRVSALQYFKSIDYLKQLSFEFQETYREVIQREIRNMRIKEIVRGGAEFATNTMKSFYEQVDPLHFGGSRRALEIATEYGRRLSVS